MLVLLLVLFDSDELLVVVLLVVLLVLLLVLLVLLERFPALPEPMGRVEFPRVSFEELLVVEFEVLLATITGTTTDPVETVMLY